MYFLPLWNLQLDMVIATDLALDEFTEKGAINAN